MDKSLSQFSKLVLLGAGALAVVVGPILYFFPEDTSTYFAWSIQHPLTPVYLGASYFAGIGNVLAVRANKWSLARVQLPAIIFFTLTMLVATLMHIEIFNWSHPVAWGWLAVYVISPVAAVLVVLQMERGFQRPAFASNKLPASFSPVMLIFAAIYAALGLALFFFPEQTASLWAWSLTPLTARVIGGWCISGAALQYMLAQQQTIHTARVGIVANFLITSLHLIGAFLHFSEFNGSQVSIWLYLLLNLSVNGFSIYSWVQSRADTK